MKLLTRIGSLAYWYISSVWLILSIALKFADQLMPPWKHFANSWWMPFMLLALRLIWLSYSLRCSKPKAGSQDAGSMGPPPVAAGDDE